MTGLVLVRSPPRLDQAISVSDALLEKGEIVSTRGRNAEETQRFNFPLSVSWQADYPIYWRHSGHARSVAKVQMRRD
jgi:hypothetical protein